MATATKTKRATTPAPADFNKSQAVREIIGRNPKMQANDVLAEFGRLWPNVTPPSLNLIYLIKNKLRSNQARARRQAQHDHDQGSMTTAGKSTTTSAPATDALKLIRQVKTLSTECGGLPKLRELVDALA